MNINQISVVVPVYKVEPYLRKCLDSIVNQTYRDLEIILIDDGSPDSCGRICDEYAERDARIRVVHQENSGLSAARNAGLKLVSGSYIGFVDSDDWIEPDMYSYLLGNALEYQADIAVCGRTEQHMDRTVFRGFPGLEVLERESALEYLLKNDSLQNYVWDKLYRRELFAGIEFPAGKTFEDVAVMHRLFMKAEKVICLPEAKYHYLLRANSILDDLSLDSKVNYYRHSKARYEEMAANWPRFADLLEAQCALSAVSLWGAYYANPIGERRRFRGQMNEIAEFCRIHRQKVPRYMDVGWTGRAILRLTPYAKWWAFILADLFSRLYKMKHGRRL